MEKLDFNNIPQRFFYHVNLMCRDKLEFVALSVSSILLNEIRRQPERESELIRERVGMTCLAQTQFKSCEQAPSFTSCDYMGVTTLEDLPSEPHQIFKQRIPVVYKDIHTDCPK